MSAMTAIWGTVSKLPKLYQTDKGIKFAKFVLISKRNEADNRNNRNTDSWNITAWRELAEVCENELCEGTKVYIRGRMLSNVYDNGDGGKCYAVEIIAEEIEPLCNTKNSERGYAYE